VPTVGKPTGLTVKEEEEISGFVASLTVNLDTR
jgi:hypothetical protein